MTFQIYRGVAVLNGDIQIGDVINIAGNAIEEGAYRGEGFSGLREIDVSCIEEFDPLINIYGLGPRLDTFDERFSQLGKIQNLSAEKKSA